MKPIKIISPRRIFVLFFSVLVIVLAGSYFAYFTSKETIRLEVSKATNQTVAQLMQRLDVELNQMNRLMMQVNYNTDIRKIIKRVDAQLDQVDWSKIDAKTISTILDTYRSSNKNIKAIRIIGINSIDEVANQKSESGEFGFSSNAAGYGMTFDHTNKAIINQLNTLSKETWVPTLKNGWLKRQDLDTSTIRDYVGPEFTLITPYQNMSSKANEKFVLVAEIKLSLLETMFGQVDFGDGSSFYLIDDQNNIIYASDSSLITSKLSVPELQNAKDTVQYAQLNNQEFMILKQKSAINNWSIITSIPTASLFKAANNTLIVNMFVIGLLVLVFILTIILFKRFIKMNSQLEKSGLELRQNNVKLEQQSQELMQLNEMKDQILSNTSHELRTPLNGIIGIAESLLDGISGDMSDAAIKNLRMITASGRRLSNLVNDILDFAKLKNQKLEIYQRPLSLRSSIEQTLALLGPMFETKKLTISVDVAPSLPNVYGDDNRLQQIFHNLLNNAFKFTEKGSIKIRASLETNEWMKIEIEDSGIGIPENKISSLFKAFEQADGTISRKYGGTGLGLSITKQLVEMHGGVIGVRSKENKGSVFSFTLPTTALHVSALDTRDSKEGPRSIEYEKLATDFKPVSQHTDILDPTTVHYRILIVDDEPINIQVILNHLSTQPYELMTAANGKEALNMMDNGYIPDLILLDVMMPEITGYEVTRRVRWKNSINKLPILLLTAKNQNEDLKTAFEVGANDYMTKPINKFELLARISTHLQLSDWNRMMQHAVDQRTRSIRALLDHSDQGFLTIDRELKVQPEFSSECLKIFNRNIEHEQFPALIYPDSSDEQKSLSAVLETIIDTKDAATVSMMMGLLPEELHYQNKFIKFIYKLMPSSNGKDSQMMVVVTDVSEAKKLSDQIKIEHQRREMIVKTVTNERDITQLIQSFDHFSRNEWTIHPQTSDGIEWCVNMYRVLHTYKGNLLQYGFSKTGSNLHALETELSALMEDDSISVEIIGEWVNTHSLRATIQDDLDELKELFGFDPLQATTSVRVDQTIIREVQQLVEDTIPIQLKPPVIHKIKQMYYMNAFDLVKRYETYTMELAEQRGKCIPQFEYHGNPFLLNPDQYRGFSDGLVHMFRNIVEHGLESIEERLMSAKENRSTIQISFKCKQNDSFELSISDDGKGIDTNKLRRKLILESEMTRQEINDMSDEAIQNLIFQDAMSTSTSTNEFAGRGVGLAAVKYQTDLANGTVTVQSQRGKGSTFVFEFQNVDILLSNEVTVHA